MINKIVVCNDVGSYADALTRGKKYEVIAEDEGKEQIKVIGDNNRARWFKKYYFVTDGSSAPVMVDWQSIMSVRTVWILR